MADIKSMEEVLERVKKRDASKKQKYFTNICLRMPVSMLEQIDAQVKYKAGFNRTTWILQALQKELVE